MSSEISTMLGQLEPDTFRENIGWSDDMRQANTRILEAGDDDARIIELLNDWLSRYQPCVFGKAAASLGRISHCVLTPRILSLSDADIGKHIQRKRLEWLQVARTGEKSSFVVTAVAPNLCAALPNETVLLLAKRLASLYLLTDVQPNIVYLEQVFLEIPSFDQQVFEWDAGVNVFFSGADRRWWQDHRIPGGLAFSVNSVGHLVKSNIVTRSAIDLAANLDLPTEERNTRMDSLPSALEFAMQTIAAASDVNGRKATRLCPRPAGVGDPIYRDRTISIRKSLLQYDYRRYEGDYHTDQTIPSEYFRADIARPIDLPNHDLDFTYLLDASEDNFDHVKMGEGRRIRGDHSVGTETTKDNVNPAISSRDRKSNPRKRDIVHMRGRLDLIAQAAGIE
jgi:hypothetical protein